MKFHHANQTFVDKILRFQLRTLAFSYSRPSTASSSSYEKYLCIPWGPVLQREEGVLRGGGGGGKLRLQAGDLVEEGGGAQGAAQAPQLSQLTRPHHQLTRVHEVHQAGHYLLQKTKVKPMQTCGRPITGNV